MIFFIEVVLSGLMAGVMYSLVALGFVLIFKASGVFNFAQGVMALFAALTLVGFMDKFGMPVWLAIAGTIVVMIALAWVIERLMLRHLVNQEPIILFMATIGLAYVLEGLGDILWGSDVKLLDIGIPQGASDWMLDSFDIYIEKLEVFAAVTAAIMVTVLAVFFPENQRRACSARGCRRSSGSAFGWYLATHYLDRCLVRVGSGCTRRRHHVGLQVRRPVFTLADRAEGPAGADTGWIYFDTGCHYWWHDHRRWRKSSRGIPGSYGRRRD